MTAFYINLSVSIVLIVGGFLLPPMGIIDGSVHATYYLFSGISIVRPSWLLLMAANTARMAGNTL